MKAEKLLYGQDSVFCSWRCIHSVGHPWEGVNSDLEVEESSLSKAIYTSLGPPAHKLIVHACSWTDLQVGECLKVYGEGDSKSSGQAMDSLYSIALNNLLDWYFIFVTQHQISNL